MAPRRDHPIADVPPYAGRRRRTSGSAAPVVIDGEQGEVVAPVGPRSMAPAGPVLRARLDGTPLAVEAPTEAAPTTAPTVTPTTTPTTTPSKGGASRGPTPTPAPLEGRPAPSGAPGRLIGSRTTLAGHRAAAHRQADRADLHRRPVLRLGLTGVRRAKFTIASAPHDPYLEVCVEAIPGGRLTPRLPSPSVPVRCSTWQAGQGEVRAHRAGGVHSMIATGTGIAPFRSMVRDALHRGVPGTFVVLHGASFVDHLPYRDELAALAASDTRLTYVPTVSRPDDPRNRGWTGRPDAVDALAVEMLPTVAGPATRAYACGLGAMVSAVTSALKASGLKVSSETFD